MKQNDKNQKSRVNFKADFILFLFSLSFFVIILSLLIRLSPIISESIRRAIKFCFSVILPSIFPFMIISDLFIFLIRFDNNKLIKRAFSRVFKINGAAVSVFLAGLVSGFPVGLWRLYQMDLF